jgi:hypothetical protein
MNGETGYLSEAEAAAIELAVRERLERFVSLEVEPTAERLEVIEFTVRFKEPPP